jgi:hypothetical protein
MDEIIAGTARYRAARRSKVEALARRQAGLVSLRQLYALGITRYEVEAEVRAGRWRLLGSQTVVVLPSSHVNVDHWRALFEIGSLAVLDGPSALIVGGLRTVESRYVHVVVPKSARPLRSPGVVVHESRRFREEDVLRKPASTAPAASATAFLPRTKPAVAAVHTALWLPSEKEAALFVLASSQQRIIRAADFAAAAACVRKDPRRRFLLDLVREVKGGIQSIGERDFARMCAERGFPPPTRQVLRRSPSGRVYLDVYWDDFKVSVEIDGLHHLDARSVIDDSLKQNAVMLEGITTLRIPVLALRQDPEPFLDQVEAALVKGGWSGRRASA